MLSRRLLRIKVVKALYAYFQAGGESVAGAQKNLREGIDAAYDLYFQMLWLVVEVQKYALERIELGRAKHLPTPEERNPNTKFVDNRVIRLICENEEIAGFLKKRRLGWKAHPELIKELYNSLTKSDFYRQYMSSAEVSLSGDIEVVRSFYVSLEDSEALEDVLEEQSVMWNDDAGFAIIMVVKTIERTTDNKLTLLKKFKSPDDPAFADRLLVEAIKRYDENLRLVEKQTKNWDVERIALVDNLIMTTAITEMQAFGDIPLKVTLDEYIEIAKFYSTPGSNSFINGVLDKISKTIRK